MRYALACLVALGCWFMFVVAAHSANEPQPTNKYRIDTVVNPNIQPIGVMYIEQEAEDPITIRVYAKDPDKDHMEITWFATTPHEPAAFAEDPTVEIHSPGEYSFRCKIWKSAQPITIRSIVQDGHKLAARVEKTWHPPARGGV